MEHQDLFAGLIRLDLLHHAAGGDVRGQWTPAERATTQLVRDEVPELFRAILA